MSATGAPTGLTARGVAARLALAGAGSLALLPGSAGPPALRLMLWLALAAAPLGALAYGARLSLARALGWLAGSWVLLVLVAGGPPLPAPHWALAAAAGLAALGWAVARATGAQPAFAVAGLLLMVGALLAGLPGGYGLVGDALSGGQAAPWPPALAARWLDLSPATLLLECAGVDWMRHPAVYAPAGVDALGPELRLPWRGELAGPAFFLVGCGAALLAKSAVHARRASQE